MLNREEKNYEYFLSIVKYGNISRAAEALYVTQPTLSKYLHHLEDDLGIQLIDRSCVPLKLTDAGQCYYEYVMKALQMNQRLEDRFQEIQGNLRGTVTVGMSTWRGSIFLPAILPAFREKYPHIRVNLVEGISYTFEKAMLSNQVDFCLLTVPSHFSFSTTYEILGKEKIYLVGNREHPLVQRAMKGPVGANGMRKFNVKWLDRQQFVSLQNGQILKQHMDQIFSKYNVTPNEFMATENISTALNLVNCLPCFTMAPSLLRYMNNPPPNLELFEIGTPAWDWKIGMVHRKGAYLSRIVRRFMAEIRDFYDKAEDL